MIESSVNNTLDATLQGCYFADAASIYISYRFSDASASWHRYLSPVGLKHTTDTFFTTTDAQINSLHDIAPLLTRTHEIEHYRTFVSTPFGLFFFRISHAACSMTQYASITIARHLGSLLSVREPMLQWYMREGHKSIDKNITISDNVPLREWLETILMEATLINRCRSKFMLSCGLNPSDTCSDLNTLLMVVQRIQSLESIPKILSRCPRSSDLIIKSDLTVLSLVEARSRLAELASLVILGAPESLISSWRSTRLRGVYAPVFNYVMHALDNNVPLAMLAMDIAFLGPIDPVFATEDSIYLEDVHPVLRLRKILDIVANKGLSEHGPNGSLFVAEKIYTETGWPEPQVLAEQIHGKTFIREEVYNRAHHVLTSEGFTPLKLDIVENNIFEQCKRALGLRATKPDVLTIQWSTKDKPVEHIFHPIIEYYSDDVYRPYPELEDGIYQRDLLGYVLFRHLMIKLLCQALVEGAPKYTNLAKLISDIYRNAVLARYEDLDKKLPRNVEITVQEIAARDLLIQVK